MLMLLLIPILCVIIAAIIIIYSKIKGINLDTAPHSRIFAEIGHYFNEE